MILSEAYHRKSPKKRVYEVEREFLQNRSAGTHALLLTGERPTWVNSFEQLLEELHGANPLTKSILGGVVELFRAVFDSNPRGVIDSKMSEESKIIAGIVEMENYLEKVDNMGTQNVRTLPDYHNLCRIYCRVFCYDSLDPIKKLATAVLVELLRQRRILILRKAKTTKTLDEGLKLREQARDISTRIEVFEASIPTRLPADDGAALSNSIPDLMSPQMKAAFSLSSLKITNERNQASGSNFVL